MKFKSFPEENEIMPRINIFSHVLMSSKRPPIFLTFFGYLEIGDKTKFQGRLLFRSHLIIFNLQHKNFYKMIFIGGFTS